MKDPKNILYLDYAASAPIRSGALKVLEKSMKDDFANPSSANKWGKAICRRIETCRNKFLEILCAGKDDFLIFTSSATESNNTVIRGIDLKVGDTVILSLADHPSVIEPVKDLRKKDVHIKEIPLKNDGTLDEFSLLNLLDNTVKLVIITHVNNQSGVIIDVNELSRKIKNINSKVHVHVDAAQSLGKIPVSVKDKKIDSLSISSHKIGGPKGIACLYLQANVQVSPLLFGGGQEGKMRSSTQAAPLIFSFCHASIEAQETIKSDLEHVKYINQLVQTKLKDSISSIRFPFSKNSSPYILTFILPGISSDIILRHLEQREVIISSTSACSSRIKGVNPVFSALHLPKTEHKNVLRVSFSHEVTDVDIKKFIQIFLVIYNDLKIYLK